MSTELMLPDEARAVPLPDPKNEGASRLWTRWDRLIEHIQHVPMRQFVVALAAEVNALPKDVSPNTIVEAAFNLAALGLIPGRVLGHAHLIPFRMNRGTPDEYKACQLVVGYKGFLDLAYDTGFLRDVHCEVVLEGEAYRRWNNGNGPQIEHELAVDRDPTWASLQAAYCIWRAQTGGHGIEVVGRRELEKLKRRGNTWDTDPIAMAKKTPIRRAAKMWKLTGRMRQAVTLDEMAEAGALQPALVPVAPAGPRRPSLDELPETEAEEEAPPADAFSETAEVGEQPAENDPFTDWTDYQVLIAGAETVEQINKVEDERVLHLPENRRAEARALANEYRQKRAKAAQTASEDKPKKPRKKDEQKTLV